MKINCIAVDDEPLALQQISGYIPKTPFLHLVASCKSAFEAMEILSTEKVDLMFLDIQMPDLTGLEFVKAWKNGPKIIFTTAYEQYALDGFKVEALDYILKPFGFDEFLKAAGKANNYFKLLEKASSHPDQTDDFIFVKSEYKLRKIYLKDIIYIEGVREYVKIVLSNDKPILSLLSIKLLEEKLTGHFMRVHRSFIVNLDYVNIIERGRIVFETIYIPISEQYKDAFQKFIETGK